MAKTLDEVIRTTTADYLSQLDLDNLPTPDQIASDIISLVGANITIEKNQKNPIAGSWRIPTKLGFYQIGMILMTVKNICRVVTGGVGADPSYDLLAIYQENGPNEGIYITDDEEFRRLARTYSLTFSKKENEELLLGQP